MNAAGAAPSRRNFLAAVTGVAAAVAPKRTSAASPQYEFKCATSVPPAHPLNVRLAQMWSTVEQESGGRIHTQLFPNSILGGDSSMFAQVRSGAITFFMNNPGILASVVDLADIFQLGFAFTDEDEALRVADGPLGAYVCDQVATKDLHLMRTIWNSGMFVVGSNSGAVRTPDDIKGFKVRVLESRITFDLFKTLGGSPAVVSGGELYTALQTKLVDGESIPMASLESFKLYEVNRYLSVTNHQWGGLCMIANGEVWNGLPPDLQAIVERNNTRFATLERADTKALNAALPDKLGTQGLTVNAVDPAPFRTRLHAYYQAWGDRFGPKAMTLLQESLGRKLG